MNATVEFKNRKFRLTMYENDILQPSITVPHGTRVHCDQDEFGTWLVGIQDIEDVLRANDISLESGHCQVRYLNAEPVRWFEFEDSAGKCHRCFNIRRGQAFFASWLNYDCPLLRVCECNSEQISKNAFGVAIPVFSSAAIEVGAYDCYVDEHISLDDLITIQHHCDGAWVGKQLKICIEGRQLPEPEIDATMDRVVKAESLLNELVKKHKPEILAEISLHEPNRFSFDCGWLDWHLYEPESLRKDLQILQSVGKRSSSEPQIEFVYPTQSTTAQAAGARMFCKLAEKAGFKLGFSIHLD